LLPLSRKKKGGGGYFFLDFDPEKYATCHTMVQRRKEEME
jgi:hypothetical protein